MCDREMCSLEAILLVQFETYQSHFIPKQGRGDKMAQTDRFQIVQVRTQMSLLTHDLVIYM